MLILKGLNECGRGQKARGLECSGSGKEPGEDDASDSQNMVAQILYFVNIVIE